MRTGSRSKWCLGVALCSAAVFGQTPDLTVTVSDGGTPNPACHADGATVTAVVYVGPSTTEIVSGQVQLGYDPGCLSFVSVEAGSACDAASPFNVLVFTNNDPISGVLYAEIETMDEQSSTEGDALTCLVFTRIAGCSTCSLCIDPKPTQLMDNEESRVEPNLPNEGCSTAIQGRGEITFQCPLDITVDAACGGAGTSVTWSPVIASDTCDGPLNVSCVGVHDGGGDVQDLASAGGAFPVGVSSFSCSASNSCGLFAGCQWQVTVEDSVVLDVQVELSPVVTSAPLHRCIELRLQADCEDSPILISAPMIFNGPEDSPGTAHMELKLPLADYTCATARDPLHTVRTTITPQCQPDGRYAVHFTENPEFGGNWLIGGNLDRNAVIDILDFGVLISQYLTAKDPNSTCAQTASPALRHADVNGDGIVDLIELSFIMLNFLQTDHAGCCASSPPPLAYSSISIGQLNAMGLNYMIVGDINHDGVMNLVDVQAVFNGQLPSSPPSSKLPPTTGSIGNGSADD